MGRIERRALLITCLLAVTIMTLRTVHAFRMDAVWDDAYIFQRYARHIMDGRGVVWNPGGEPTYGLTALLYVLPCCAAQGLTDGNMPLSALGTSAFFAAVFVALTGVLVWRTVKASATVRLAALAIVLVCVAGAGTSSHFVSGMDTTFMLAFAVLQLLAAAAVQRGAPCGWLLGTLGGLALWIRPELCAFSVVLPAAIAIQSKAARRQALIALGVTAAVIGIELLAARLYFGSALPLPFHVKSVGFYSQRMHFVYRGFQGSELAAFAFGGYGVLLALIVVDIARAPRRWLREADGVELGAGVAALVCVTYALFGAIPIMAMHQRFFHPALPAIILLATRSFSRLCATAQVAAGERYHRVAGAFGLLASAASWVKLAPDLSRAAQDFAAAAARRAWHFDLARMATTPATRSYWARLDAIAKLPDEAVIATTEVGLPGALCPNHVVVDLAGLNERAYAHAPFNGNAFFERYNPDFIYLPHPDYRHLVKEIHPQLEERGYLVLDARRVKTNLFGVALRRDSPYFATMKKAFGLSTRTKNRREGASKKRQRKKR